MAQLKIIQDDRVELTREYVSKNYSERVFNERWKQFRSPEFFTYRQNWYKYPGEHHVAPGPIHLDIETTTYCNLKCPMCERTVRMKQKTFPKIRHMDMDFYRKIIDEGVEIGVASIKLNYLGEPLMHPDVVEQVRYAKEKGIVDVMFNTNAVFLDDKMARDLMDAGLDSLFISFDSANKEKFEAIRIGTTIETVYENAMRFFEIRNSDPKYHRVQYRVSKVILKDDTAEDLNAFLEMFHDKADSVGFNTCMDYVDAPEETVNSQNLCCEQPWQRILIRVDGKSYPCCMGPYDLSIGNANEMSIKDMWHGKLMNSIRDAHRCGQYMKFKGCATCDYLQASKLKF